MGKSDKCYLCNRSLDDIQRLLNVEKLPNEIKMADYKYDAVEYHTRSTNSPMEFDSKGVRVYPFSIASSSYDITEYVIKNVADKRIVDSFRECYKGRVSFTYYAYKDLAVNTNYWLEKYLEEGGTLLLESEVRQIRFEYSLCPICHDLISQIVRLS